MIAGRADLVAACARHPLARALRPGALVLLALQDVADVVPARGDAGELPFWRDATTPVETLRHRADRIHRMLGGGADAFEVRPSAATPGASTAPGVTIPSVAVVAAGHHRRALRDRPLPVIARVAVGSTWCDLRTVVPGLDEGTFSELWLTQGQSQTSYWVRSFDDT